MKVQLVKAPTNDTGMPEHNWYTPLNLIWLASYLVKHSIEVEILDGQLLSLAEILTRLDGDIVGVSFDILSLGEFGTITQAAKARGAFTVAGGHLATAVAEALLEGTPSLDALIRYDGEEALLGLVRVLKAGLRDLSGIPNLLRRGPNGFLSGDPEQVDLAALPMPKRDVAGITLEPYFGNFQATKLMLKLPFSYERPTNTYSHKGCPFRAAGQGCSFCSRVDRGFRVKPASRVYAEYSYLVRACGVDYIADFSDSWVVLPFLGALANEYEAHGPVGADLRVYGDVRLIGPESVRLMRELGVDTVLLGIESGSERVLRLNGKPVTRCQILSAVAALGRAGIKVADAYVLGMIGETRDSVMETVELARQVKELCQTEISYWNIMTPMPGSIAWALLAPRNDSRAVGRWTVNGLDTRLLEQYCVSRLCDLGPNGYEFLSEVRVRMLSRCRVGSSEFVPASSDTVLRTREERWNLAPSGGLENPLA